MKAAYCRVSTGSEDQANSFENQKLYFEKQGGEFYKIYADKGISGTKLSRTEFDKMLYDAGLDCTKTKLGKTRIKLNWYAGERKSEFTEIWVKNTSRFARNTLSYEIILELRKKKVALYFIEQDINTLDPKSDFVLGLLQNFDAQDSRDKSSKVKWGQERGKERGIIHTNGKILGYNYIQHENRLEIEPTEAETVRKIFELYDTGLGTRRIITELMRLHKENKDKNSKAYTTKSGKPFTENHKTTILNILTNEKYAGFNNRFKHDTGEVFSKNTYPKVKEQYDVTRSNKIPAIIDEAMFNRVKERLKSRTKDSRGIYHGNSEYADKIYCGTCGAVYHRNIDKGRVFYNCSNKKMNGKSACNNPNISEKNVDKIINLIAQQYPIQIKKKFKDVLKDLDDKKLKLIDQIDQDKTNEVTALNNQIDKLSKKLISLYNLAGTGQDEELRFVILQTKQEKQNLEQQMDDLSKDNVTIMSEIANIDKLKVEYTERFNNLKKEYTKEDILNDLDRITIDPELGYTLKLLKGYLSWIIEQNDIVR